MPHFYESLPRVVSVDDSVELRASSVDEGDAVARAILDHLPHFSRWFPWATQKYSPEGYVQWLSELPAWDEGQWEYSIYVAPTNSTKNLVGRVSVFINPQDVFEFGYWLIPSAQGQGIMTRSLERIEQLMAERGISNAEIWVEAGNERSQKLAVRNGYSEVRRDSQRASNPGVEHIVLSKALN